MEKRKPHYDLKEIKELLADESTRMITEQAIDGAVALGYMTVDEMLDVVNRLQRRHFWKSMTVHGNSRLWQDVYMITDKDNDLYIKLQIIVIEGKIARLVQFKRDERGGS